MKSLNSKVLKNICKIYYEEQHWRIGGYWGRLELVDCLDVNIQRRRRPAEQVESSVYIHQQWAKFHPYSDTEPNLKHSHV